MPQQYQYLYPQNGYCTSTATTTNYIPIQQQWYNTSSSITVTNQVYRPMYTTTGYQTTDTIWQTWVQSPNITWGSGTYTQAQTRQLTPDEVAARDRQIHEERTQRRAARTRARLLLEEFLDDGQKVELERHGRFHVTGSRGRRYCIRTEGQSGNVDLLKEDGSVQARLCCHPRNYLPEEDAWLMQMIEIRHDEDHFLRTANVHRGALPVAA